MRTPALRGGPPSCWSFYRGEDICQSCPFVKSCRAFTKRKGQRKTVGELYREVELSREVSSVALHDMRAVARSINLTKGIPVPEWVLSQRNLREIRDLCVRLSIDPCLFLRAQILRLSPLLKRGVGIRKGHLTSAKAFAWFKEWVAEYRRQHGQDRHDHSRVHEERTHIAAAVAFLTHFFRGQSWKRSIRHGRQFQSQFSPEGLDQRTWIAALHAALSALDPSLPHLVTCEGEISIMMIRRLRRRLRSAMKSEQPVQSSGFAHEGLGVMIS